METGGKGDKKMICIFFNGTTAGAGHGCFRAGNKGTPPPPRPLSRVDPCRWANNRGCK